MWEPAGAKGVRVVVVRTGDGRECVRLEASAGWEIGDDRRGTMRQPAHVCGAV